jgi:drug/metabolite transporter (DMT)-like permease
MRLLVLVLGVIACSTAALMIKAADTDPALVAAWRLLLACPLLWPLHLAARRRHPACPAGRIWRRALPAGLLLAAHFWSWNIGVRWTGIANASLVVNLTPVVMPIIAALLLHERPRVRELLGTAIALAGTILLAAGDAEISARQALGDLVCFGSMLTFAIYLAWGRRSGDLPSIWLYMPPVYLIAGLAGLGAGAAASGTLLPADGREWLLLAGLALVPTITGHTILNHAMRHLRSQVVAIVNLGQFIPAGVLAWCLFDELPGWQSAVAAPLVVGGCVLAITARRGRAADLTPPATCLNAPGAGGGP